HLEGEVAAGADATLAGAVEAGVLDDVAVAAARLARAGGHDLAEKGALHLLDLAAAGAHRAGAGAAAGLRAGARAGAADHGGVDGQRLLAAEDGGGERDVEAHEGVVAALDPRARAAGARGGAAEEGVHDVA